MPVISELLYDPATGGPRETSPEICFAISRPPLPPHAAQRERVSRIHTVSLDFSGTPTMLAYALESNCDWLAFNQRLARLVVLGRIVVGFVSEKDMKAFMETVVIAEGRTALFATAMTGSTHEGGREQLEVVYAIRKGKGADGMWGYASNTQSSKLHDGTLSSVFLAVRSNHQLLRFRDIRTIQAVARPATPRECICWLQCKNSTIGMPSSVFPVEGRQRHSI